MATVNPPKKHKYPVYNQKKETKAMVFMHKIGDFFKLNKKMIIMVTSIVLAVAIVTSALIIGLNYYFVDTPYDGIRFADYIMIPEYFGMELSQKKVEESFEKEKNALLKKLAMYEPLKSGVIKEGHNVTISAEGFLVGADGSEVKVAKATISEYEITDIGNHVTETGAGFSKEIQDAIIGTNIESVKKVTANIEYPDDYAIAELKGQNVKYYVTIKKVTETIMPDYTDAVVKEADSRFTGIAQFEDYTYRQIKLNLLWNKIVSDSIVIKYPEKKLKIYRNEFDDYYNTYMEQKKLTFDKLLSEMGITGAEYESLRTNYAESTVKEEIILYFIVKTEKIRVASSDYKTAYEAIAFDNGYSSVDDMLKDYSEDVIERTVLWEKVKSVILEKAVSVE